MVLTARNSENEPAYEKQDEMQARNEGLLKQMTNWEGRDEINTARGVTTNEIDRAYQIDEAGTNPSDGYPCRLILVEESLD